MSRPAVIVDMDGSLVDVSGIRHYVRRDPSDRNFTKFHAASSFVPPMPMVVEVVRALHAAGLASLIVTARKEQWRYRSRVWLRKWDVPVDALGMRGNRDERRDDDVKRDLYIQARRLGFDPVLAIEDNPLVMQLWRSLDIPTVVVPGWDAETLPNS